MKVIEPGYEILTNKSEDQAYKELEKIARTCYKSEDHITEDGESAKKIIKMLIGKGHYAMLDHIYITVKFICDRGISHEIVRHRMCAFAQESTRYCNYSKDKFGNELTFIKPYFFKERTVKYDIWEEAMSECEKDYLLLLSLGATPQEARSVLPNSLKTEIVVTADITEWRHIFTQRCSPAAHPQMREIMIPLLSDLKDRYPLFFADIWENLAGSDE